VVVPAPPPVVRTSAWFPGRTPRGFPGPPPAEGAGPYAASKKRSSWFSPRISKDQVLRSRGLLRPGIGGKGDGLSFREEPAKRRTVPFPIARRTESAATRHRPDAGVPSRQPIRPMTPGAGRPIPPGTGALPVPSRKSGLCWRASVRSPPGDGHPGPSATERRTGCSRADGLRIVPRPCVRKSLRNFSILVRRDRRLGDAW
jgi:hypothetical protein